MKSQTLPTKRRPVTKGVFHRLSAVTQGHRRKQRAATSANARDFEDGEGGARIGRALFVILVIHLLAIAMILVHHHFLSDRPAEEASAPSEDVKMVAPVAEGTLNAPESGVVHSQLSPNETPYIVAKGDTYATIAAAHQISEEDLRELNGNVAIGQGYLLKIPVKRVVIRAARDGAAAPSSMQARTAASDQATAAAAPARDQGLVPAVDTRNAPRATAVSTSTDGSYVVKAGDTIWGIANRHGVKEEALKAANGITDPRKLRAGMTLKIP